MRIGIVPVINPSGPSGGGVYQYSMTMLRALHERTDSRCEDEFVVFSHEVPKSVLELLNGRNWTFKPLVLEQPRSLQQKILDVLRGFVGEGPHREAWRWLRGRLQHVRWPTHDILESLAAFSRARRRIDNWHFDIAAFPTKRLNVWSAFPRNYATLILIGCLRLLDGLTFPLATLAQ